MVSLSKTSSTGRTHALVLFGGDSINWREGLQRSSLVFVLVKMMRRSEAMSEAMSEAKE
jgi:hypothetical protein